MKSQKGIKMGIIILMEIRLLAKEELLWMEMKILGYGMLSIVKEIL